MKKELQVFDFKGNDIRITSHDGMEWFVAEDIAKAIGYSKGNTSKMCGMVDDEYKTTLTICTTGSYTTNVVVISEPGLWQILAKSRKPLCKPFQKWLYEEVLPQIRETGSYSLTQEPMPIPEKMDNHINNQVRAGYALFSRIDDVERKVDILLEKIDLIERVELKLDQYMTGESRVKRETIKALNKIEGYWIDLMDFFTK